MITEFPQPDARLLIFDDPEAVAREAARRFVATAGRSVEAGALCRVALSGGTTPLRTYRLLASDEAFRTSVHWPSVELFWGDERFVPHDDAASNYGAAREAWLDRVPIVEAQVHPIPTGATDPAAAAGAYEETLRRAFGVAAPEPPRFNLVFLGLGTDGHTASLFPGALPEGDANALAVATRRPEDSTPRVTLTPRALNAAQELLFLVTGEEKAEMLKRALGANEPDPSVPATLIRPERGKITWLADRAAAAWVDESGEESPDATVSTGGEGR